MTSGMVFISMHISKAATEHGVLVARAKPAPRVQGPIEQPQIDAKQYAISLRLSHGLDLKKISNTG
jgi:hypothetical protein